MRDHISVPPQVIACQHIHIYHPWPFATEKAHAPLLVRSYKSLEVAAPGQNLPRKCLAVDPHKVAKGATGLQALCLEATVGGASTAHHLCSAHLRRPLLLVEDFQGPTGARFVRYCVRHGHQTLMPISDFSGFAKVCNAHTTAHTLIGRTAVVPASEAAPDGVVRQIPQLETLHAGPAGNPHRRSLETCDAVGCSDSVTKRKTGLCCKHKKVCRSHRPHLMAHVIT